VLTNTIKRLKSYFPRKLT